MALLKKQPEPMPYVSPGPGTLGHLVGEYWAEKEKVRLAHVAYKGSGQAMNDLVGGHVKLGSLTWTAALGQMKGGMVIPIAVSSARRMPGFESVPTLRELGYPDMAVTTWFGFAAPANLPATITQRMNEASALRSTIRRSADGWSASGIELERMSPAELTAFIKNDLMKWAPLAKRLIPPDGGEVAGSSASPRHHLRQQPPVALHRLADRQPQLDLPAARRHRMHHRHAEVLLQRVDHIEHAPAGAEQIDRVGLAVLEEGLLHEGVDLVRRKLPDLAERDVEAFHAEHVEAGLA